MKTRNGPNFSGCQIQVLAGAPLASLFLLLTVLSATSTPGTHGYWCQSTTVWPPEHDCGDGRPLLAELMPNHRATLNGHKMSEAKLQDVLEVENGTRAERVLLLDADPSLAMQDVTSAIDEAKSRSQGLYVGLLTGEARRVIHEQHRLLDCIGIAADPSVKLRF
jgi:biopolymer transport protein ExbD